MAFVNGRSDIHMADQLLSVDVSISVDPNKPIYNNNLCMYK